MKPTFKNKINELPQEPGIYLFKNKYDAVIYVGKSINIKKRVGSYFSSNSAEERTKQLVHEIADVDFIITKTELLALLVEDVFIKHLMPRFNIRQREFNEYVYLELVDDLYPWLKMLTHEHALGKKNIYGPFKDKYVANDLLQLIYRYINIRSCNGDLPTTTCLQYDMGQCIAQCIYPEKRCEYDALVQLLHGFFKGENDDIINKIEKEITESVHDLNFEKAQVFKKSLTFVKQFGKRQTFYDNFRNQTISISNKNGDEKYLFKKGELVFPDFASSQPLPNHNLNDERFLLDRAQLLYSWYHKNKNEFSIKYS